MVDPKDVPRPSTRRRALDHLIRPTRAEIDRTALCSNLATVRGLLGPQVGTLAVVKANAYGHGATLVAQALEQAGVELLGVALVEEGIELRNAGVRADILVLGGSYEGGYDALVRHQLVPTVFRPEHLAQLADAARRHGSHVQAHLKVDTGMGRIGVLPSELDAFLALWRKHPEVTLDGLLSHFANADLADTAVTLQQVARFREALRQVRAHGFSPRYRHLANSAGVMDRPEVRDGLELNLVRPGLMLYGYSPAEWLGQSLPLEPVLSWKTGITHLKSVPVGTPVSYGGTWVAQRPSLIATLPVGYADGYDRHYSSRASVLVRGRRVPVVGRVCMDMCLADVTDVPGVQVGDEVVLLGAQGEERISAHELAALADTLSYEVLCAVGARVPRVAVDR